MLDKAYEPQKYEDDIYKRWEESGFFNPDVCVEKGVTEADAKPFSIVLPPPNVTGTLHMGHAAMLAIEDMMVRYHRMKGDRTLWVPGTDHAAVATESKVEGLLIKDEGFTKPKEELGREKFLERVKNFAQDSHDTIVNQSKKMGSSLDWSREAYTLDDERNLAVRTVFKDMYDAGLIYRGYRVVNWSVKGQSTCSDDELVHVERPGKLYYFKYSKDFPISIATTRPETKLGDTAVAVHPEGKWKDFIGKEFTIADFGQAGHTLKIKIIGDASVATDFGTGALGVTTAHSQADFEMYLRQKALGNDIGLIQVIGEDGKMTVNAGAEYAGLSIEEARAKVVQWLKDEGLLEKEEDTIQNVGTSDRFKDVVEPLPKTQWFIDVNKQVTGRGLFAGRELSLKEMMQEVVRNNNIEIVPDRFNKTYFHWIDNLRDWCISRQIWFGHQIPVWYKGTEMYCGVNAPEGDGWTQDPDSLDTWFSAGLWTFSALGWPGKLEDFKRYHPTSVLETGYDILFFWVARMILMTTYTLGEVPFKTVYLHGLVRDEQGRKMSKSLGNIIDPLDMIAKYGTDATRLSLLLGSTPGNDVKLSEEKIAGFRNFTNKLWNISRFTLLNIENPKVDFVLPKNSTKTLADSWILDRLERTRRSVTESFEKNNFSYAGD
nr:valine--tRNA ligase [Candidatus Magasanikbacteria bacterium]